MRSAGSNGATSVRIIRRKAHSDLYVVGISSGYHDAACCLLVNGRLVAAAQEERFSRIKNDRSFPRKALRYCLDYAGLSPADIDCVAYYEDPCLKLGRQLWMLMEFEVTDRQRAATIDRATGRSPQEEIRQTFGYQGRIEIVNHHLSHAASGYFFSGFPEAAVLTVDGVGDWPTTTYSRASGAGIECFEEVRFPHSLGLFYSAITSYLGFEVNEGEYKLMGLAPYGQPRFMAQAHRLIDICSRGQYRLDLTYFDFCVGKAMYTEALVELFGERPRPPESEIRQVHMDIASSVQAALEEVLLDKVHFLHSEVDTDNLCMAGGVALNVVANSRCLNEGPFNRLFVQPAAGDAGGCIGAAAVAHVRMTGMNVQERLRDVYLGPEHSNEDIGALLHESSAKYEDFRSDAEGFVEAVVDRLVDGKIIGWFQGRMEFGPRALGARSILADPRNSQMRDRINESVKMREAFRPFAPAVLEDFASTYFALDHASPFMLEVCEVISTVEMPAVTHVDGSARVQTVNDDSNPRFAALLSEFGLRTGCPVLLNTSFNVRGEPIVCSPLDALLCFAHSKIDTIAIGDFILDRENLPLHWEMEARQRRLHHVRSDRRPDQLVYTLV